MLRYALEGVLVVGYGLLSSVLVSKGGGIARECGSTPVGIQPRSKVKNYLVIDFRSSNE